MSNILNDSHRQEIAAEILKVVNPASYVECGCHIGESMNYWNSILPQTCKIYGCDSNAPLYGGYERPVDICRARIPSAQIDVMDSVAWLEEKTFEQPIIFYLDTDWAEHAVKDKELEVIFAKYTEFVIIMNGVNRPDHPACVSARPFTIDYIFDLCKDRCGQFIIPTYGPPQLQSGYAIAQNGVQKINYDPSIFCDLNEI